MIITLFEWGQFVTTFWYLQAIDHMVRIINVSKWWLDYFVSLFNLDCPLSTRIALCDEKEPAEKQQAELEKRSKPSWKTYARQRAFY